MSAISQRRALAIFDESLKSRNLSTAYIDKLHEKLGTFSTFTGKPVVKTTTDDVRRFLAARSTSVEANTAAADLGAVRCFFRVLINEEKLKSDPTDGLTVGREPPAPQLVLSEKSVAKLLATASEVIPWERRSHEVCEALALRNRAVVELLYGTGMRASEVAGARVVDLALDRAAILCRRAKRGPWRYLPLPRAALPHLGRYVRDGRPFLIWTDGRDEGRLFITERGEPVKPAYVFDLVDLIGERAGVPCHPHALRRSLATSLVRNGAGIVAVRELLGHQRLQTTERYVAVDREDLRRAVAVLEADGDFRQGRSHSSLVASEYLDDDEGPRRARR